MSNPFEIMRPFPDYPDYEIGDEGSVRHADGRQVKVFWTGGRAACKLNDGGRQRTMSVARAMLRAFVGEPPRASYVAMPKNGDLTDLCVINWEWRPRVGLAKPAPTAKELRQMPQPERNEALRQAAEQAVAEGYEIIVDQPLINLSAAVAKAVEKALGEVVSRQQYDAVVKDYAAQVKELQSQRDVLDIKYKARLAEMHDQIAARDQEIRNLSNALVNLRQPWWRRSRRSEPAHG